VKTNLRKHHDEKSDGQNKTREGQFVRQIHLANRSLEFGICNFKQ
jgi:hypothetical protein